MDMSYCIFIIILSTLFALSNSLNLKLQFQFLIEHHLKEDSNYYDYCKRMNDISIPYDEICILALADLLERNMAIISPRLFWTLRDDVDDNTIIVVMVAKNNVYGTRLLSG